MDVTFRETESYFEHSASSLQWENMDNEEVIIFPISRVLNDIGWRRHTAKRQGLIPLKITCPVATYGNTSKYEISKEKRMLCHHFGIKVLKSNFCESHARSTLQCF